MVSVSCNVCVCVCVSAREGAAIEGERGEDRGGCLADLRLGGIESLSRSRKMC